MGFIRLLSVVVIIVFLFCVVLVICFSVLVELCVCSSSLICGDVSCRVSVVLIFEDVLVMMVVLWFIWIFIKGVWVIVGNVLEVVF